MSPRSNRFHFHPSISISFENATFQFSNISHFGSRDWLGSTGRQWMGVGGQHRRNRLEDVQVITRQRCRHFYFLSKRKLLFMLKCSLYLHLYLFLERVKRGQRPVHWPLGRRCRRCRYNKGPQCFFFFPSKFRQNVKFNSFVNLFLKNYIRSVAISFFGGGRISQNVGAKSPTKSQTN